MKEIINQSIEEAIEAVTQLQKRKSFIQESATMIATAYQKGGKLLIAGNGGSLCDATHFAEELTGYFRNKRKALPAIALADPGHITCVSNDSDFNQIFSRGIEAYAQPHDIFIGLTTSGNSPNIVKAFETAKQLEMKTIAFLGKTGGALKGVADLELIIEGFTYSDRIQEAHMTAIHIIIECVEKLLFTQTITPESVTCSVDGKKSFSA